MAFRAKIGALDRSALKLGRALQLKFFVRELFTAQKIVESDLRDLQAHIALFFIRKIVPRTPWDTGKLRTNWQLGINRRPRSVLVSVDKTAKPDRHEANPRAVSALVIARARNTLRALPLGAVIHIVNNAPYLDKRNEDGGTLGPNKNRPGKFIERTIEQAEKRFGTVTDVTRLKDEVVSE